MVQHSRVAELKRKTIQLSIFIGQSAQLQYSSTIN